MRIIPSLILSLGLAASAQGAAPLWMRDVRISPDGQTIAFTYRGDIFTVPAAGGKAVRLTATPAYEQQPVWSPDGSLIAFASDRAGGADVYVMPAAGGDAVRLTFNSARETPEAFTPDGQWVVYSAAIADAPAARIFPSGRMTEVYKVPVKGGRPQQILSTPAERISYLPGGDGSFLYQDRKGYEDEWRKHHTSSVTRDLWKYDAKTGRHTNLTDRGGEDRDPVAAPDGTVYFLSERDGGSMNVYSFPAGNPADVKALTSFTTHPVRFLSRGSAGTLAFGYDGEIYTMRPGAKPAKVAVDIVMDTENDPVCRTFASGATQAAVSPDGKQVAFVYRGDIFVTSADYKTTRQITETPQAESFPVWDLDNRTLYYTSDRDGARNILKATIVREEDPDFPNATLIEESQIFDGAKGVDRGLAKLSPDGKKLAYVKDRRYLAVSDTDGKNEKVITTKADWRERDGEMEFEWSPDSRWIVATVDRHRRALYYDIAVIDVATGDVTNVTNSGYLCHSPRWVMNGDAILFLSDRYGMRNHASWGSLEDVFLVFTNRAAYDRYRLSPEDYALEKQAEKDKKDKKKDADKENKESKVESNLITMELDGIEDRMVRITPFSSDVSDAYVDDKGETLWFLSSQDEGYDLWKKDLRKGDVSISSKLGAGAMSMQPDKEGKNLFLLGRTDMRKMPLSSGKLEKITYSGRHKSDPVREREYLYDYIVGEVAERHFDRDYLGTDWKGYTKAYRKFLPHISNNADFAEMTSELLGELNASHTGSRFYGDAAKESTASLGLLYDMTYGGPGLKVAEVLKKGPFGRASSQMKPGAVITSIGGSKLSADSDPAMLLADLVKKKTLVEFTLPGGEKVQEVVLPISQGAENTLLYERWVKRNEQLVDSLSKGRLGYVHIESMDDASFRNVYSEILGRYNEREGIVIDTRFNGGGRLHEDIEVLFSGDKYLTQEIRGEVSGEMPSRRWNKPSIMLVCEANYSNAHGTPWVYTKKRLGKTVGMPVPGTMSSVNWIRMQDPTLVFGVPVVGFRTAEGNYLERTQLEPDIKVANTPERIAAGYDDQIEAAVAELLKEL